MRFILGLFLLLATSVAFGKGASLGLLDLEIEPVIGYEHDQLLIPYRHTKETLIYGVRVIAGIPLVSAEAEVTRGTISEDFPDYHVSTKDVTDKAKLGLRSTFRLMGIIYAFGRAGGQAKRNHHTETRGGISTSHDDPIYVHPYVGAGLRARLTHHFRFDADFTMIFPDTHNWQYYEYQAMAGFAIVFP